MVGWSRRRRDEKEKRGRGETHVRISTQETPTSLEEERVRILVDGLHDGRPGQVDGSFRDGDVDRAVREGGRRRSVELVEERRRPTKNSLQPLLNPLQHPKGNRVDVQRRSREVGEHKHEIELLQPMLHSLEVADLDLVQGDDGEGHVGEVNETVRRRLEKDVGPEGNSLESELSEGDVDLELVGRIRVVRGDGDLLGEGFELSVEGLSQFPFLLLELDLVLVSVSVLPLLVSCLVELDVGSFARELDVLQE